MTLKLAFVVYLLIWNAFTTGTHCQAILSTDKQFYSKNEPIRMSWNYTSRYKNTDMRNNDIIAIFYNNTIPTFDNQGFEAQMVVYVSTLWGVSFPTNSTVRNSGVIVFDGNPPNEQKAQRWPLNNGIYKSHLMDSLTGNIYASSATFAVRSFIQTSKPTYEYNEPIPLEWFYYSNSTTSGNLNGDFIAVVRSDKQPSFPAGTIDMRIFVNTFNSGFTNSTRNTGNGTLDKNLDTGVYFNQAWPLGPGSYKLWLIDGYSQNYASYAISDTFFVKNPISTDKSVYEYDRPITITWSYISQYTTRPNSTNTDLVAIYNLNQDNSRFDVLGIMFVAVSTLEQRVTTTIRNNGMVIFDGNPPNEAGSQTWPLQVGTYEVWLIDLVGKKNYFKSDPFTVVPRSPTKSPTKAPSKPPTKAPSKAPTKAPTKAPSKAPTKAPTKAPSKAPTKAPIKPATLTTNLLRYAFGTPIKLAWDYTSRYNGNETNYDTVAIVYNSSIPNATNLNFVLEMYVSVSLLRQQYDNTTRDVGTVTFDSNDPVETVLQSWPLKTGYYRACLLDLLTVSIYAFSDTFTVFSPSEAPTNAPAKAPSQFPTKAPTQASTKTPTKVATKAPTNTPTNTPMKAPANAPVNAPTKVPVRGRKCGLFGLGYFCPLTFCGFFGRLILGNSNC